MNKGLYIHIPFCQSICSYCDFTKFFYDTNKVNKYLDALVNELASFSIENITSIYVGGGTPTSLNEIELEKLLNIIKPYYKEGMSYTFEANVENLSINKIILLKKYGVNRVSMGVQTFNDNLLKIISRHHNEMMVKEVISSLHNEGIDDINIDLIYGLPTQTIEDLKLDLEKYVKMNVTHISTYALSINDHTLLKVKDYKEQDDEVVRNMYDLIVSYLKEHGFNRYEVSNFSKTNYESKHNLIYWHNEEYYGIGCGASGYINNIRYENTKSLDKYINGITKVNEEIVTQLDKDFYQIMLGLRLTEGIKDYSLIYEEKINDLIQNGLLEIKNERIKVKDDNLFILDYILEKILF